MSLHDLRSELRELRKTAKEHAPISRMKKSDVAAEVERLKKMREETPAPAAVPSAKSRKEESAKKHIMSAKETEFPHSAKPHPATAHSHKEYVKKAAEPKKKMSKAMLKAMLDEMTSSDEE